MLINSSLDQAHSDKATLIATFHQLCVPLEPSKLEGPSVHLPFLGMENRYSGLDIQCPTQQVVKIAVRIFSLYPSLFHHKKRITELDSLLQFATKIAHPGRLFLRQLYTIQNIRSHLEHHVRLNSSARADILWWHLFTADCNVISMLWDIEQLLSEFNIVSDASGSLGFGAYWDWKWFNLQWPAQFLSLNIATKELLLVVIAAVLFGSQWQGQLIQFTVNNMAIVHDLKTTCNKDSHLMHLICILVFIAAHSNFWFIARYIEDQANTIAVDLSCNNVVHFFTQFPWTRLFTPPPIPDLLVNLLSNQHLDWTSAIKLDQAVWFYYESGLSSIHKTYEAAKCKYLTFCSNLSFQPLPTTENILRYFVACLG